MFLKCLELPSASWADCADMKPAVCIGLLWLSLWTALAQGSSSRLSRVTLFGSQYVRLDDWARVHSGQVRWTVPKRDVRVTLPTGTLTFSVDSRMVSVKGTTVSLSVPIAYRNGLAYLGAVDVDGTLGPLLSPSKYPVGRKVKSIVLDPGHGGKDPGNQEGRRQEKQFTLLFAKELKDLLTKAGFSVTLTRSSDLFLEPSDRPDIARKRGADLFLSLHYNSVGTAGGSSVNGAETYCMTLPRTSSTNARGEGAGAGAYPGNRFDSKNVLLAYQIQKAITEKTGAEDRGVKRARFAVLRGATMPAVLIEAGFMTNWRDAKRIYDPVQRRQVAQAVVDGVLAYKRLVER
jgi:N-acetylmuramoyl-L-alanine amidase